MSNSSMYIKSQMIFLRTRHHDASSDPNPFNAHVLAAAVQLR
jgi:hypothetical protein